MQFWASLTFRHQDLSLASQQNSQTIYTDWGEASWSIFFLNIFFISYKSQETECSEDALILIIIMIAHTPIKLFIYVFKEFSAF